MIQKGSQRGKRVELWKDCTTIGRSRECDIFLEDVSVHRKQAHIIRRLASHILRDDHGSGDSIVNGTPIIEHILKDSDQILFGNTTLTFFAQSTTRQFQLASSRGRELHVGKKADPHMSMVATLELTSTKGSPRSFELQPKMTIGRSRTCSIFLEDLTVSRRHATVYQLPNGEYEIEDHCSATGTFVNGRKVTCSQLRTGDIIHIGENKLIFQYSSI